MKNRLHTLTVNELIDELRQLCHNGLGDAQVVMTSNYGDRGRTTQALNINEIKIVDLRETGYSETGYAVEDPEENFDRVIREKEFDEDGDEVEEEKIVGLFS